MKRRNLDSQITVYCGAELSRRLTKFSESSGLSRNQVILNFLEVSLDVAEPLLKVGAFRVRRAFDDVVEGVRSRMVLES